MRLVRFFVGFILSTTLLAFAGRQSSQHLALSHENTPPPDIGPIMQKVISNERASEAKQQDYLLSEWLSSWDGVGNCWSPRGAKTYLAPQCQGGGWRSISGEDRESEVFWLEGVRVSRLVRVSKSQGSRTEDRTLPSDELREENARIDAELAQVAKASAAGDADGEQRVVGISDTIHMSRFLELGIFSNSRWGADNSEGRGTIVVDYKGGPCSRACAPLDDAAGYVTGTLVIDEEDLAVAEFNGTFTDTWIGPGTTGWKVLKGSTLTYRGRREERGLWFPFERSIETTVRHGSSFPTHSIALFDRDYRKFRVTSTILPDVTFLPADAVHEAPPGMSAPR